MLIPKKLKHRKHHRGEREFNWAGYQISITVPGRDHVPLQEFNVGGVDEYWIDKSESGLLDAQGIAFSSQNQLLAKLAPMHRDVITVK